MNSVADFPALAVESVIGFVIRSPPRSEPEIFFCKFLCYKDSVLIIKIQTAVSIVAAVLVINICFRIVPENRLLSAVISKNYGLCAGGVNCFFTGMLINFPCWSCKSDLSGSPFAFHILKRDICPVSAYIQSVSVICHKNCIIAVCLTKVKAVTDVYLAAVEIHKLTRIAAPAIRRCGSENKIILNQQLTAINIKNRSVS